MNKKLLLALSFCMLGASNSVWAQHPQTGNRFSMQKEVHRDQSLINRRDSKLPPTHFADFNMQPVGSIRKGNSKSSITNRSGRIATLGDGTEIWGSIVYAQSWSHNYWYGGFVPFGYYSFKASSTEPDQQALVYDNYLQADGGGTIVNDTLYVIHDVYGYGSHTSTFASFDTRTWERIDSTGLWDFGLSACDVTYDPTTGKVYGQFSSTGNENTGKLGFGTVDYHSLTKDIIQYQDTTFVGIACDSYGQLYGITLGGNLAEIDKETGNFTIIGSTGVTPTNYRQSAAFDLRNNQLYWAAQLTDGSYLLEVDTQTGKAQKIFQFPDEEEITCLYVPDLGVTDDSPASVKNLKVDFQNGSLNGTVSFTAPDKTFSGSTLKGDLQYTVTIDGKTVAENSATPGQAITENVSVANAGEHAFSVVVSNDNGKSQPARYRSGWIGYDTPTITAVHFAMDKATNIGKVSWTVKGTGIHGGFINKDKLHYEVYRYPESTKVASDLTDTVFTETLPSEDLKLFKYGVIPVNDTIRGSEAFSNQEASGTVCQTPYLETFDTKDVLDQLYTVVNNNDDYTTWNWNSGRVTYSSESTWTTGDDWLITPKIHLSADNLYYLTYDVYSGDDQELEVLLGNPEDASDVKQYKTLIPEKRYEEGTSNEEHQLKVDADGDYRIAFRVTSYHENSISLDNIGVRVGASLAAPDSVTNLHLTAGEKGAMGVKVEFNAPVKTIAVKDLASISKIDIYRNDTLITSLNGVTPGSKQSYDDNSVNKNGINSYRIIASNEKGVGAKTEKDVYVGQDIPGPVTNLKFNDNGDGTATMTWDAPSTTGPNGHYVDPAKLNYRIYYEDVTYFPIDTVTANSYTVDIKTDGMQSNLYYNVTANNVAGEGTRTMTPQIIDGGYYTLPFKENFYEFNTGNLWWGGVSANDTYRYYYGNSSDGDNGCVYWYPYQDSNEGWLNSGKFDIKDAQHPVLSFAYYALPGNDIQLYTEVDRFGEDSEVIDTLDFNKLTGESGWRYRYVDLTNVKDAKYIIIKLHSHSTVSGTGLYIDDYQVRDVPGQDLSANLIAPKSMKSGVNNTIGVEVRNEGHNTAEGYTVQLLDEKGNILMQQDGKALEQDADTTY